MSVNRAAHALNLQPKEHSPRQVEEPKQSWTERKNTLIDTLYEREPLLIERQYVRKKGRKVEQIVDSHSQAISFTLFYDSISTYLGYMSIDRVGVVLSRNSSSKILGFRTPQNRVAAR